jgi:hypothetical protein
MSLEDIEKKFYSTPAAPIEEKKENEPEEVSAPSFSTVSAAPSGSAEHWQEEKEPKLASFKKFLFPGIILFTILVAGVFATIVFQKITSQEATSPFTVDVYTPSQMYRGAPAEVSVEFRNDKNTAINDATVSIVITDGLAPTKDALQIEEKVQSIGAGETYVKKIPLFAVGDVGSLQKIKATIVAGKETGSAEQEIFIKESGIRLSVDREQVSSENSKYRIHVSYENVTNATFDEVSVVATYPSIFSFESATPNPTENKNTWKMGKVQPHSKGEIIITGSLLQTATGAVRIPVAFNTLVSSATITLAEQAAVFSNTPAPVVVNFRINGKSEYISSIGENLSYEAQIKNQTGVGLADVIATIKLESSLFNFSELKSPGTFNSAQKSIEWTAAQVPKFRLMGQSDEAKISFTVPLLKEFPMKTANDKNYTLKGTLEITSPTIPQGSTADKTFISIPFETKVTGYTTITTQAWRKDPWGILNTGVIPLQADHQTQYTIHWKIKNYATDVHNVVVKATLEPGVTFTGVLKTGQNLPAPVINNRTQEISWTIPTLKAGSGVVDASPEAVFQVSLTPNITQVGKIIPILGETTLSAVDDFTGVAINDKYGKIDTRIQNDPTFKDGDEKVIK